MILRKLHQLTVRYIATASLKAGTSGVKVLRLVEQLSETNLNLTMSHTLHASWPETGKVSLILAFLLNPPPSSVGLFRLPLTPPPRPPFAL